MPISGGRRLYSGAILTNIEHLTIPNLSAGYVNMCVKWVGMRKLSPESSSSDRTLSTIGYFQ